jgi:hypothetical protein
MLHIYTELVKSTLVPVCEKLVADGALTSYGLDTEDYHKGLAIHLGEAYEEGMQTDGDETTPPGMQRLVD